jgi:hypothetical protein
MQKELAKGPKRRVGREPKAKREPEPKLKSESAPKRRLVDGRSKQRCLSGQKKKFA